MARSKDAAGDLIASKAQAAAQAQGIAAGSLITPAQLAAVWRAVADGIFTHDASAAEVALANAVAPSGGGPVTGKGGPIT